MAASNVSQTAQRITGIDLVRGIASLSVCWYHLTTANPDFLPEGILKASGKYGWLGVEAFFVISGFIIPFSLYRSGYKLRNYATFIVKRITRLDPPYLVSMVICILLIYLNVVVTGRSDPRLSLTGIALHLGYLNMFFNYPWLNAVYWSLAIELQYYVLMGLMFPLLIMRNRLVRLLVFFTLGSLCFLITSPSFIFAYIFLFLMGITAFQKRSGLIKTGEAFILYGICFLCSSWTLGLPHTIAGAVALYLISAVNLHNVVLNFLGNISYSLYLLHAIIGGSVISIGIRVGFTGSGAGRVAVLIAALAASLFSAFMLYLFVEKPAQKWSSSFVYKPAAKTIPDQTRMALQTTINPSGAVLLSEKNVPTEGTAN
jgi:peptidoglycan/LPS O-acetylase OafA/YrhL